MRTVTIKFNNDNADIKDAINSLIFEVHHDFLEKNMKIEILKYNLELDEVLIDDNLVTFDCHCKEDPSECQCDMTAKIRKALFKAVNWSESGCGCGGNCGCH